MKYDYSELAGRTFIDRNDSDAARAALEARQDAAYAAHREARAALLIRRAAALEAIAQAKVEYAAVIAELAALK